MTSDTLLSIREAAELAKCDIQKIHRLIRNGNLPASKVGWNWVIRKVDLEVFLHVNKGE